MLWNNIQNGDGHDGETKRMNELFLEELQVMNVNDAELVSAVKNKLNFLRIWNKQAKQNEPSRIFSVGIRVHEPSKFFFTEY